MGKAGAITFALLSGVSSLALGQGAPVAMGEPPAARMATPGATTQAGFTIDQKGVKRVGSSAPAPGSSGAPGTASAAARRAGPLPGNGKDANSEINASGNKSYFESRSNTARGDVSGGAKVNPVPTSGGSANKSFFESRSNTARTDGAAARATPEPAPSAGSTFKN
jgi:hypothetical protein